MTDDEINSRIAEIAGWQPTQGDYDYVNVYNDTYGEPLDVTKLYPNYVNDTEQVLRVLKKEPSAEIIMGVDVYVAIYDRSPISSAPRQLLGEAIDQSISKAVCLALIQAHKTP